MKKIFALALSIVITGLCFAQELTQTRTITVNGMAEVEIIPDEIYVQIDLREYMKKNSSKIDIEIIKNNFLLACNKLNLKPGDIALQNFHGWDANNMWTHRKKKKDPNMLAIVSYQVKLSNTNQLDELVNLLDDEATQNFFIARVSHSRISDFKRQLKIEAIKAAKAKAIYLTEAIGEKVGVAITINEPVDASQYPQQVAYANTAFQSRELNVDKETEPAVEFKKIKLQFEVSVVFALQ